MPNIRTRIPKESQADKLMIIAKNLGKNRNDILIQIISEMAENLPESKYQPDSNIQINITGIPRNDVKKIETYCNSINSCFGEELKRKIDEFIRRHHQGH